MAIWPSGKAEDCKFFIPSSNPGIASNKLKNPYALGIELIYIVYDI